MKRPRLTSKAGIFLLGLAAALLARQATATVIMEWDASDWAGPGNDWNASVSSEVLVNGAGDTSQGVDTSTFAGTNQQITYAEFDGDDSLDENNSAHPLSGLQEFSISVVFRTTDDGTQAGDVNQFWRYNGILGKELPGAGQGDWGVGVYTGPNLGGGAGLAGGDDGVSAGNLSDDAWHTLAFVVDQDDADNTMFTQSIYVDGSLVGGPSGPLTYGGGSDSIAATNWAVGAIRDGAGGGDNPFYVGDVAHLRFDDVALDANAVVADAANFLGTLEGAVPEPTSFALFGLGCLGLGLGRKRQK